MPVIAYDSATATYDGAYTYDGVATDAAADGSRLLTPPKPRRQQPVVVGPTAQQRDDEDVLMAVM